MTVLFDMDGVIIDSDPLWNHIVSVIKDRYALDMSVLEKNDGYNLSTREAIRLVLEDMGRYSDSLFDGILSDIDRLYAGGVGRLTTLEPGITEVLEMLESSGAGMVLVSNSSRCQVDLVMARYGLDRYFSHTLSADDVTKGKPDGEAYRKALCISGARAGETVVVEDSDTGVAAAMDAGLMCIRVSDRVPVEASSKFVLEVHRSRLRPCLESLIADLGTSL